MLLIITVSIALLYGTKAGCGFGFAAGVLQDLFLGGMLGVFVIIKTFSGGIAGLFEGSIFKDRYIIAALIISITSIAHELLLILLSDELMFNINYIVVFKEHILPTALLNGILGYFIYFLLFRIKSPGGSYYE